jgi:cytochrome c556
VIASAKRLMGTGALAAVLVLGGAQGAAAQAAGGAAGRRAADPPAIAYRKAMMAATRQHIAAMRALLSGEISHPDDIKMHADALANIGLMFAGLFPEGSTGPTSRAMDEIWAMEEDFTARVSAFRDATQALKETAKGGNNAATIEAVTAVNVTCRACHTPFRKPAAPPAG